jgi:3-hydroxyacyl-[acyl-carrier-protein] dehydratase
LENQRFQEILACIPHQVPFRFIDEILEISPDHIVGAYRYKADESFYPGHFPGMPVTPGVILTETMAQIGLVAFGIFLENMRPDQMDQVKVFFTKSDVQFHKMVLPETRVIVKAEKDFFRLRKLQCRVRMETETGEKIASGILAGMFAKIT